jgi:hypothetical protein
MDGTFYFADGSEAFAKSLFFGGVTRRFPRLRVGMLEGGTDWGAHYTKGARQPRDGELDDFAAAGIERVEDIKPRWADCFFFGSESDDRAIATAFNDKANPLGVKINAIYSSDVGRWDVPDLTDALAEAYGLVEEGILTEADFKAYVFENPYRLYTEANPEFFKGTAVEAKLNGAGK